MKKLSAIMVALVLAAVSAVTVFAAGINSNEQAVIDKFDTPIVMQGKDMYFPTSFINGMTNYFNTIDMTAEESKEIIAGLQEAKDFLEGSGADNIDTLTYEQKQEFLAIGQKIVGVLDMTMVYDKTTQTITIYAPDGTVAFAAKPTLTTKGQIAENPIKVTGAATDYSGVVTFAVIGGVLLAVAGGTLYFVKSKKERA